MKTRISNMTAVKTVDLGKVVAALSLITTLYATTVYVFMSYIGLAM